MTPDDFRTVIAEQGETAMLIAADAMQDSCDPLNNRLGRMLRLYCDIQTYIRMSQPIPESITTEYNELNKAWDLADRLYTLTPIRFSPCYSNRLGPYYLNLIVDQGQLADNLALLSDQPVRNLIIHHCQIVPDLALILRNYRFEYMSNLTLRFTRGQYNVVELASYIRNMVGYCMHSISINPFDDRLRLVQSAFMSNKKISPGCEFRFEGISRKMCTHG